MKSAKELMLELVAVSSVSESPGEVRVAERILELVREDKYFAQNPGHCGAYDGGDAFGRPVIWALKKGSGSRTIVFSGHYDTVDTASYGAFAPLALDPVELRRAMRENPPDDAGIRADLEDENWMFGRGCADMKAGIALNIEALYNYAPGEVNVLFTAVSDEENLSAGARQAVGLYAELAQRFGLEYSLAVISEPTERQDPQTDPHPFIHGSAGKILPVVVARGIPAHSSNMLRGINSAHIISGVIAATEYDLAFVSQGGDMFTEPPAAQMVRDMKTGYDVSMPEYTACAFNMTFFTKTDPVMLIDRLVENCRASIAAVQKKYDECFSQMESRGQIDKSYRRQYDIRALTLEQLESELEGRQGFGKARDAAREKSAALIKAGETMQWAVICYIRDMIAWAGFTQPVVVVGIAPPYYPAVHTDFLAKRAEPIIEHAQRALEARGISTKREEYSQAMMDLSYMSCANSASARRVMGNIPLPGSVFGMDIDAMAALEIPTLVIGPARREIHQIGERVWLPDVERDLPRVFEQLIDSVNQFDK